MRRLISLPALVTVIVLVFLYLPIIVVVINAFNRDESLATWDGATTHWIRVAFSDHRVQHDFLTSLLIALSATVIAVALSLAAVMAASRIGRRASHLMQLLTYARLMMPEVVFAAGILLLIQRLHLNTAMWSVVAGHVIFCSAYATLVLQSRYATLTGTYDEAAADLGAPPLRVFVRVLWPMMAPAIVISALLSFTFSFDDVVSTVFLASPTTETLPMLIMSRSRHGITPEVNAIAVAFMCVTLLLMTLFGLATLWRARAGRTAKTAREGIS